MHLPRPRGPVSDAVVRALRSSGADADLAADARHAASSSDDVLLDDDVQLALWTLYELHYRGFEDADDRCEWDPCAIAARLAIEGPFEQALRTRAAPHLREPAGDDLVADLERLVDTVTGPSLARYVQRSADREQLLELMVHRSVYHLKESDPASWTIARLDGPPKTALAELQYDEYGSGRAERLHATLFGDSLEELGLSREYGGYVDVVPAATLALNNAMSLFGLHRRLRGASLGHLAAFEMTSSLPCRRFAQGIRRLGLGDRVAEYFDEHVEADAVHEQIAMRDVCGGLVAQEPGTRADVLLGAAVCLDLENLVSGRILEAWTDGRSSLLGAPVGEAA